MMAVFDRLSRYVKPALVPYEATDLRGRKVLALPTPEPPTEFSVGRHVKKQQQRLDHLAAAYLKDANGFWRIAVVNGAVYPDALLERELLEIPAPNR
jgi:hypothetical protein